jgi:hypothetical protein
MKQAVLDFVDHDRSVADDMTRNMPDLLEPVSYRGLYDMNKGVIMAYYVGIGF